MLSFFKRWSQQKTNLTLITKSGLFDTNYYINTYPDIKSFKGTPLQHYFLHGENEGRKPNPYFDPNWYRKQYSDIVSDQTSLLLHYINEGETSGCKPSAIFNPKWYKNKYLKESTNTNPLYYFLTIGLNNNHLPSKKILKYLTEMGLDLEEYINKFGCSLPSKKQLDSYKKSGLIYSQAVNLSKSSSHLKIAIAIHVYYLDMMPKILDYLSNISFEHTLFFSVTEENKKTLEALLSNANLLNTQIIITQNKGYDIYPFIQILPELQQQGFDLVCKIHTKKGVANLENHVEGIGKSNLWFKLLIEPLLGSKKTVQNIINAFESEPDLGLIGSASLFKSTQQLMHNNEVSITKALDTIDPDFDPAQDWGFIAGTMFWSRLSIYEPLINNKALTQLLIKNDDMKTGKVASFFHAFERVFGALPKIANMRTGLSYATNLQGIDHLIDTRNNFFPSPVSLGLTLQNEFELEKNYQLIENKKEFNEKYYVSARPVCKIHQLDPLLDFLRYGIYQDIAPHPKFSPFSYWSINNELIPQRQNALVHYLQNKKDCLPDSTAWLSHNELIKNSGLFRPKEYLKNNPDIANLGSDALKHYCQYGWKEERELGAYFDAHWYRAEYLTDFLHPVNPLLHYLVIGKKQGLLTRPRFLKKDLIKISPPKNIKRICLFAAYDPDGLIDESVIIFIKELAQYSDVYFLSDSLLQLGELKKLSHITKGAWANRHGEYDFGSYKRLAKYYIGWETIEQYDELLLVNDSSYLIKPLADTFSKMDAKQCSWWGMQATKGLAATKHVKSNQFTDKIPITVVKEKYLESYERDNFYDFHIGSYFLAFRKPILQNGKLKEILGSVSKERNKKNIIIKYEIGITRSLINAGFDFDTAVDDLYPFHPIYTNNIFKLIENGYPLFKRFFLTENHYHVPQLWQWKDKLQALVPSLNLKPIESNLYRIADAGKLYNNLYIEKERVKLLSHQQFLKKDQNTKKNMSHWVFPVCAYDHVFSGNERAVFESIKDDPLITKIILYRSKPISIIGSNIKLHPLESLEGQLALLEAGVIFIKGSSSQDIIYPITPNGRKIINLWHGIPLKRIGVASLVPKKILEIYKKENLKYHAVISSSKIDKMAMAAASYPLTYNDIWVTGLPRNDFILREKSLLPNDFLTQLTQLESTVQNKNFILYVPTFRNEQEKAYYHFTKKEKTTLLEWLDKNNAVLGIREHMADTANSYSKELRGENVISVNNKLYPNVEVLYRKADILITDYSSCFIDYMLTGKPMISFAFDYEHYMTEERGFFYDMEFVFPGPICKDFTAFMSALQSQLQKVGTQPSQSYLFKRNIFFDYIDCNNADRVIKKVQS